MLSADLLYRLGEYGRQQLRGGPGVNVSGSGDALSVAGSGPGVGRAPWAWYRIESASEHAENIWRYTLRRVRKALPGPEPEAWVDRGDADVFGWNACEVGNEPAGLVAAGIDLAGPDFPPGFELQPIRSGMIVQGFAVWWQETQDELDDKGDPTGQLEVVDAGLEVWFAVPNDVDGEC